MKKILVPVDFSDASRNATAYAASFAEFFDAEIILLHALLLPDPVGDMPGYIPLSLNEMQEEHEALLQREIEWLGAKSKIKADGYVRMGSSASVIKNMAAEIKADVIVMGMKGAGKTSGIFGSTVTAGLRMFKTPMLIIPEGAAFSMIENICVASDFANLPTTNRYKVLKEIASEFNAELHILHVQKPEAMMHAGEVSVKMGSDVFFDKIRHSFHTVEDSGVEKGIGRFIEEQKADILVMVAHHHNIFERIFGKSHTKLVSLQTRIPLLVLHD